MASFPTDLHAVIDKLTPSAPIPTAKTIDNNYSGVEAQASEQASMAQAKANQSAAQTDFALANTGLELARKEQYTQEHAKILKKQLDEQKYNNTLHKAMFQVRNIYSDALFKLGNTINRDESTAITSTTNASVFGLVKTLSAGLPKKQADLLQEYVQSASTYLNQVNQRKIQTITQDNNYITLAKGLVPAIQQIAQSYLNAPDNTGRTKALEQGRDYINQIDNLIKSATTLEQRDRALSLRNKLQAEMHVLTTETDVGASNAAQQGIGQSNHVDTHNQNSLGTADNNRTSVENVFFNSAHPYVNQNLTGGALGLTRNHNEQQHAERLRQDLITSNTPIALLQQGAGSTDPLKQKLYKKALDEINQGKALDLIMGMNPSGPLNEALINYDKALAGNDSGTVYKAYQTLRNAVHATASRWGISEDKFSLPMPNTEANYQQFIGLAKQTDNTGKTTGYNLNNKSPDIDDMMHKVLSLTRGKNLPGGTPLVKGLNYALGEQFNVVAGRGYVPMDNHQAQLDVLSFNREFQNFYASKRSELYRNKVSNPDGILKVRNRGSLRSNLLTSGDFPVREIAQVMGVSPDAVTDSIMAKIEYKAYMGDENAIQDVQRETNEWVSRRHIVTIPHSHLADNNVNMSVSAEVLSSYTNGVNLNDRDLRIFAHELVGSAYNKLLETRKQALLSQWSLSGYERNKDPKMRELDAEGEVKLHLGDPSQYTLINHGAQLLIVKSGNPSTHMTITPLDAHNTLVRIPKYKEKKNAEMFKQATSFMPHI